MPWFEDIPKNPDMSLFGRDYIPKLLLFSDGIGTQHILPSIGRGRPVDRNLRDSKLFYNLFTGRNQPTYIDTNLRTYIIYIYRL